MRNPHELSEKMRHDQCYCIPLSQNTITDWILSVEELEVKLDDSRRALKSIRKTIKGALKVKN